MYVPGAGTGDRSKEMIRSQLLLEFVGGTEP